MTQMPSCFDAPLSDVASYNTREVCIAHIVEYANEMLLCLDSISDISDLDSSLENFSAWAEFFDVFAQFHVASFELAPTRDRAVPDTEGPQRTVESLKMQLHAIISASVQQLIIRIREDAIGESMDRLYALIDRFDDNFYDTLDEQFAITGKGWATLKHEIDVHLMRYLCKDRDRWMLDHHETAGPKIDTRANPLCRETCTSEEKG